MLTGQQDDEVTSELTSHLQRLEREGVRENEIAQTIVTVYAAVYRNEPSARKAAVNLRRSLGSHFLGSEIDRALEYGAQ